MAHPSIGSIVVAFVFVASTVLQVVGGAVSPWEGESGHTSGF